MIRPIARDPIYRRRRFEAEIIELCVRWYITYRLSYRLMHQSPRWLRTIQEAVSTSEFDVYRRLAGVAGFEPTYGGIKNQKVADC
jgi:hypothetical protein